MIKMPIANLINQAGRSEINYMVIRYADVLLMYAEAQNEAVGADASVYDAVNRIRQRAGLVPMPYLPVKQKRKCARSSGMNAG